MNMQAMMQKAQKMQKKIQESQELFFKEVFEEKTSVVTISANGKKEIIKVKIEVEEFLEKDGEVLKDLEDMILIALNNLFFENR